MLRRIRWFSLGIVAGIGGSAWVATQLRRARQQMTVRSVGSAVARGAADMLDAGGQALTGERGR